MTTTFRRAAAVAGAMVCLLVILATFSEPARERGLVPSRPAPAARAAERARVFRFTVESVFGLVVISLISSTFGGMLGMGGGVLKVSFLLFFFGFHQGVSRFAALLAYFVVAAGASYRYMKLRFVMMDVVKILMVSSTVGIVLGAIIGHHLPREALTVLLGMFLLFTAVVMARRVAHYYQDVSPVPAISTGQPSAPTPPGQVPESAPADDVPRPAGWRTALCGLPGGILSAMLGISGGIVTTPLQQVLARIPIKNAIANTLTKASVTVPIACVIIMALGIRGGHFDFWTPILVALCLVPGSIVGSQVGPALTRRMSPVAVHALLCAVALFMGINMLFFGR
ncbi:MAG: sulfite exporter TauE/SafE family protein [Planctomycetota bacterium]|jgi:uncharacterized membrane protein YfcA